jgi:hypothetical protein
MFAVCVEPRMLVSPKLTGSGEMTIGPYCEVIVEPDDVAVGVAVGALEPPPVGVELAAPVGVGVTPPGVEVAFTALYGYGPTVAPCWQAVAQARRAIAVSAKRGKRIAFTTKVSSRSSSMNRFSNK